MSHSALIVFRNSVAETDSEYRNGHGSAPVVWSALARKYERHIYPNDPLTHPPIRSPFDEWGDLWKAVKDKRVELRPWEWIALQWTYDNALVRGDKLCVVADALERFADAHALPGRVCHLEAMAARMRELAAEGVDAVGLYATSVGDNPWHEWSRPDDDGDAESQPYDLRTGTKHWFVDEPVATKEPADG